MTDRSRAARAELRPSEIRAPEIRPMRASELRAPEARPPEARGSDLRSSETRLPEIRPSEIRAPESRSSETRLPGEPTGPAASEVSATTGPVGVPLRAPEAGPTPRSVARRVGYALGLAVDLALLVLVNAWPGWWTLPVLTRDFEAVLVLLDVSLVLGAATNLVLLIVDRRTLKAAFDVVTTAVAVAVAVAVLRVFPFGFGAFVGVDPIARIVLLAVIAGTGIAFVVQLAALLAILIRRSSD